MPDHANWDLTSYFPTFNGPEYLAHVDALVADIETMRGRAEALGPISAESAPDWAGVLCLDERILAAFSHLASYVGCLAAADVRNEGYKQAQSRLSTLGAALTKAFVPIMAALRAVDDESFAALEAQPDLAGARYYLGRLREDAARTMDPELERLAADLGVDGFSAWGRLYDEMSGRLEFDMNTGTGTRKVPMAQKRGLLEDPDPAIREQALVNSNRAWQEVEYVTASCLNAIAGTRLTLYRYRGREDFLEKALFDAAVERETVESMWKAVAGKRETAWRYLRKKAELLGKDRLGFQDLSCPIPRGGSKLYSWDEARNLVLDAFSGVYPRLGEFSRAMFDKLRVESEKRAGKQPGAFCTTSLQSRESRVFMTFGGGLGDVQTLAHELGHAFHSSLLKEQRPFAARYPMTLAETASTFAERTLQNAVLDAPSTPQGVKLQILAARLNDAATFLCDIHMRYVFEKDFYAERKQGEVSVSRLKELMLSAQNHCFGDTLDQNERDPMFWASKLHFYITGVSFYNFPYTFGYLLSLVLAGSVRREGEAFLERYEEFLRLTGSDTAEGVARRALGADIRESVFWEQAMEDIALDMERFEAELAHGA